ncbi:MAG: DUF1295 domain-containing protein [Acidimicrobiia bacterium]|nr:DUF1295 domain-containing protein [Acidimicrobiia bacterium]
MTALTLILAATLIMSGIMFAVWLIALRLGNAGIVDIAWAGGFSVLAAFYAGAAGGNPTRRLLVTLMVGLWSLRLARYLYRRVRAHHPVEDGRYAQLRREWGSQFNVKLLFFFQLQALLNVVLSLPLLLAGLNRTPYLYAIEWFACALWATALVGEWLADTQLERFKANPDNRGRVCEEGLWRYSRHPNYFFEWLVWVSYFLFASASAYGLLTIYCPALVLYFLLRVTGIPVTEQQALRSKGEAYRRYRGTTSPFVPWFRRSSGSVS